MKAEDLMIGDWVNLYDSPIKINIDDLGVIERDETYDKGVHCKPIPLTEEILKKNGFKTDGKNLILHYKDNIHESALYLSEMYMADPPGYVTGTPNLLTKERPCNIDVFGVIHYVHDLQHLYKFRKIKKEIVL